MAKKQLDDEFIYLLTTLGCHLFIGSYYCISQKLKLYV